MARKSPRQRVKIGSTVAVDNPLLRLSLSTGRQRIVLVVVGLAFAVLAGRAIQLQLFKTKDLQRVGERSYTQTVSLAASRGKILDRHDTVLASSLPARAIYVDPQRFIKASHQQVEVLAGKLGMSSQSIRRRVQKGGRKFAYLKRQVSVDSAEQIEALDIPGVAAQSEYKRHYPEGMIAAHVVGFTDYDDIGKEGVEHASDLRLAGRPGSRRVIRDRFGRVLDDLNTDVAPIHGEDEQLAIDSRLQYLAFNALRETVAEHKAKAGAAIALDVRSGEILALANWPSYDPNDRSGVTMDAVRNRVVYDSFEPGSTMKPFTVALALELRKVTPNTIIETAPGKLKIGPDTIGDSHFLGALSVSEVIEKSSNVAIAKMALDMEAQQLWQFFSELGFGLPPGAGFPGAAAGRLRPHRSWRPIEQATMAYGHGLSVTLLQLAHAYMIFARDGNMPPVDIRLRHGTTPGRQIISEATAKSIRSMLELAVGSGGTASKAQVVGYRVAGKTGTSLKQEKGKYVKKYVSSFVGFVPASDPRILIAVMIDEPTGKFFYAGDVAAPLFSRIAAHALRQLRIAPDAAVAEIQVPGRDEVARK
ncbi:MAG: penicillin-binding protein 2 [Burkholderiaceae bacterium]